MRSLLFIGISLFFGYSYTQTGTINDARDGKVYKTVVIGNQTWMAENLNTSKFRNGDPITEAKTNEDWIKACENKQPAWCYYDNDPANGSLLIGVLYNWYAVIDSRGLAPIGWHIPSETEWSIIEKYTGGNENGGKKMKAVWGWNNNTGNGTNESGFSALPSGFRNSQGEFYGLKSIGIWWSSSSKINRKGIERVIRFQVDYLSDSTQLLSLSLPNEGYSVRCIKDSVTANSNSTSQNITSTNNTTTSNINDFESNVNNISDINSRLKYVQNVIGTAASQNDTKLLTRAIIQYNSNILSDPNIDKELFIFGRLINESSLPQILQNGISEDEKSMFSVSSFYYVMCQLNIENNFDALNKDIVNGILNNFSSNSYFSKDLYLALEKKKNEIQNLNSKNQHNNETEVFFTTLSKLYEITKNSNFEQQSNNSSKNSDASTTRNAQWVDVDCDKCNKDFKFRYWDKISGWKDEFNSKKGFIKCSNCEYGKKFTSIPSRGEEAPHNSCYVNTCNGGWIKCGQCSGTGKVRELH